MTAYLFVCRGKRVKRFEWMLYKMEDGSNRFSFFFYGIHPWFNFLSSPTITTFHDCHSISKPLRHLRKLWMSLNRKLVTPWIPRLPCIDKWLPSWTIAVPCTKRETLKSWRWTIVTKFWTSIPSTIRHEHESWKSSRAKRIIHEPWSKFVPSSWSICKRTEKSFDWGYLRPHPVWINLNWNRKWCWPLVLIHGASFFLIFCLCLFVTHLSYWSAAF